MVRIPAPIQVLFALAGAAAIAVLVTGAPGDTTQTGAASGARGVPEGHTLAVGAAFVGVALVLLTLAWLRKRAPQAPAPHPTAARSLTEADLAEVRHELNNLLAGIQGHAHTLHHSTRDAETRRHASVVLAAAERAVGLSWRLRELTKETDAPSAPQRPRRGHRIAVVTADDRRDAVGLRALGQAAGHDTAAGVDEDPALVLLVTRDADGDPATVRTVEALVAAAPEVPIVVVGPAPAGEDRLLAAGAVARVPWPEDRDTLSRTLDDFL